MSRPSFAAGVILLLLWPAPLAGQPASPAAISLRGDVVPSEAGTRAVVASSVTFQVTDRVVLDGELAYFAGSRWSSAIAVAGSAQVALNPGGWSGRVVPYLSGGLGYHRASVRLSDPHLLGPIPDHIVAGEMFCASRGSGTGMGPGSDFDQPCSADPQMGRWGVGDLPEFYAARLGPLVVPASRRWDDRTFNDPAMVVGGGVRIAASERMFVQPEARIWIVAAGGRTRTSGLFGISAGFRF